MPGRAAMGIIAALAPRLVWGRLSALVASLWKYTRLYPLQAIIAALVILAGVQTWRLSGVKQSLTTARAEITKFAAAQVEAEHAAQQALADTERKYRDKAHEADRSYQAALVDARDATQRYIDLHRVRQDSARPASQAITPASGSGTGVSTPVPADSYVAVSEHNMQACTDAVIYGVKAHDWAVTLGK